MQQFITVPVTCIHFYFTCSILRIIFQKHGDSSCTVHTKIWMSSPSIYLNYTGQIHQEDCEKYIDFCWQTPQGPLGQVLAHWRTFTRQQQMTFCFIFRPDILVFPHSRADTSALPTQLPKSNAAVWAHLHWATCQVTYKSLNKSKAS